MTFLGMRLRPLVHGILTLALARDPWQVGTGGTGSARYCYSVWFRHLLRARQAGLRRVPSAVAELGPGDSVGIGLAALLSGADRYYGLDAVVHSDLSRNLGVFEELIELFRCRAPIPGADEFPEVKPTLAATEFPEDLVDPAALEPSRLDRLRLALRDPSIPGSPIRYIAPWNDPQALEPGSIDFLLSQAVLEHIDDLPPVYSAMQRWVRDDGLLSHQIDYRSHGLSVDWDGHRACPDWLWYLVRGRRPFLLNRLPHSAHLALLERAGFELVHQDLFSEAAPLPRERLARRFRDLDELDRGTSGAFVQARKRLERLNA